jgi:hypothetical protein
VGEDKQQGIYPDLIGELLGLAYLRIAVVKLEEDILPNQRLALAANLARGIPHELDRPFDFATHPVLFIAALEKPIAGYKNLV